MTVSEEIRVRVNRAWDDIEVLMRQLDPVQLAFLAPPAEQGQIDAASQVLGQKLSADIEASLLRHDGCLGQKPFLMFHFLSAIDIAEKTIASRKKYEQYLLENPGESLQFGEGGWHELLVMFGTTRAGYELVLEMPHCETAIPYFFAGSNYSMQLARDLPSYLEAIAYHLRQGNFIRESGKIWFDHWAELSTNKPMNPRGGSGGS